MLNSNLKLVPIGSLCSDVDSEFFQSLKEAVDDINLPDSPMLSDAMKAATELVTQTIKGY